MKLTIPKHELARGLARIQPIVQKRSTMRILANVLLSADQKTSKLCLSATDLEVGIRSEHEAAVDAGGVLTVSAQKFYEIVKELPEEQISLEMTENSYLSLLCGRSKFTLAGIAAEEYPTLPWFSPEKTVTAQAVVLSTMIENTIYAASADETRYNLNGVYFEVVEKSDRIRMVATDGHRLARVERSISGETLELENGVIIPRKGLSELKHLADEPDSDEIELAFEENYGLARKGGVTLVIRLIEGEFPNYQQVIPKEITHRIAIDSDALARSLRRVAVLSSEKSRAVKLDVREGKLILSSSNPDLGDAQEEIDIDFSGEALQIGFNVRYLLDALAAMNSKEIFLGIRDELQPAHLAGTDDPDCFGVVMPMRIPGS